MTPVRGAGADAHGIAATLCPSLFSFRRAVPAMGRRLQQLGTTGLLAKQSGAHNWFRSADCSDGIRGRFATASRRYATVCDTPQGTVLRVARWLSQMQLRRGDSIRAAEVAPACCCRHEPDPIGADQRS